MFARSSKLFGPLVGLLMLVSLATGCASYSEQLINAQASVIRGDTSGALRVVNSKLGVRDILEVPSKVKGDAGLLLLERAALLQAQGNYKLAARDMVLADQVMEFLDIGSGSLDDIGTAMYSGDAGRYRAPAYERLMLNTLNMVNFLAMQDLEAARVEARRFTIMERYYLDDKGRALMPGLLALGNYLSGISFESSRDYQRAASYYARAWHFGMQDEDLRVRLAALMRMTAYDADELKDPSLTRLFELAQESEPLTYEAYRNAFQTGDTLVVVQSGLVPYKRATRVPVGSAVTMSSTSSRSMSDSTRSSVVVMSNDGSLDSINFPELTDYGLPVRGPEGASLRIGGQQPALQLGMNVGAQVVQAWERIAGTLMAAAITRAVTRAVVGGVGRAAGAVASQSDNEKVAVAGVLGWLAATVAEGAMSAADTPDTRSWSTLPAFIHIARLRLPPGLHPAEATIAGASDRQIMAVWPDRLNVVNFSRLR
jgi:hypothetical protein